MINKISIVLCLLLLLVSHYVRVYFIDVHDANERKSYIVYMGENPEGDIPASFLQMNILDRVLDRTFFSSGASKSLLHSYKNFNGFVVKLTPTEMQRLADMDEVVSVFPNEENYLDTTKSWDFMGFTQQAVRSTTESDIIIGVFDTGIWPESDSFNDIGLGPPPAKWKGTCDTTLNFACNNKIIGAKYYHSGRSFDDTDIQSPRDSNGHGTHCASIAAGRKVSSANMVGFGDGTARGGVPSARIAVYKVCWSDSCTDADMLAAFDDAIGDGVDIISISIGGKIAKDYFKDVKAIGSFHAMKKKGIITVNSAGNYGPKYSTTASVAPWFLSVAASTIDRNFVTNIELGNGSVYKGVGINTFDLQKTMFPMIYGGDAPNSTGGFTSHDSKYCIKNSLNSSLVKSKIVLCEGTAYRGVAPFLAGSTGVVTTSSKTEDRAYASPLPASDLDSLERRDVYYYYQMSSEPTVTIFKSEELTDTKAPYVASFSSRGPNNITKDLLKPDITAPGVHILAAWPPNAPVSGIVGDNRTLQFNIISGTSMACPHVSAMAAYIKSYRPTWSPAAIKSALMTTATPMDKTKNPQGELAYGSGQLNPLKVLNPGLVYDLDVSDYVSFLCGQGYTTRLVRMITGDSTTNCSSSSSVSDLNVPSFALSVSSYVSFSANFSRNVTNVGPSVSNYSAIVQTSADVNITVVPSVLSFESVGEKLSFVVTIEGKIGLTVESASLTWDDGSHKVRSPIVVYAMA